MNPGLHTNWSDVLNRYGRGQRHGLGECGGAAICGSQGWADFIIGLEGVDPWAQIAQVNRHVNAATYRSDLDNYGRRDYWATPDELFAKGGDCEDYAVAKFFALRALGFSNRDLRLVVVKDTYRNTDHAVLVVYFKNEAWMLDNLSASVVRADWITHYRPYYSLNDGNVWLHKFGAGSEQPAASANAPSHQRTR